MVTLKFVFNKEKTALSGKTEEELLQPMREHAKKYGIDEIKYGVFAKNGEHALASLTKFIPEIIRKEPGYMDCLSEWTLNVNGEEEDCIEESRKWLEDHSA